MNKIISLLSLIMLLCVICAFGTACGDKEKGTEGVIYGVSADGTYVEVIGYTGTDKRVVIESEYQGKPVTDIYSNAFNNSFIKEIVLPDTILSIGDFAFFYCTKLTSVVIPDSVTSIGSAAFRYCRSLTSIVIPDSVTSIGYYAFDGCSKLQFTEYENCKYLGSKDNPYFALIEGVSINFASISIHNDAKIIANYAFNGYSRLASITIPDSVTSIGSYAFRSCSSLTSVVIGDGVTSIGKDAFTGCLIESARIPAIACTCIINSNLKTVEITSGEIRSEERRVGKEC